MVQAFSPCVFKFVSFENCFQCPQPPSAQRLPFASAIAQYNMGEIGVGGEGDLAQLWAWDWRINARCRKSDRCGGALSMG